MPRPSGSSANPSASTNSSPRCTPCWSTTPPAGRIDPPTTGLHTEKPADGRRSMTVGVVPAINATACRATAGECTMLEHHRILVVEDNIELNDVLCEFFRDEGFAVTPAVDGRQAITRARQDDPDVIVLAVILPDIDGIA